MEGVCTGYFRHKGKQKPVVNNRGLVWWKEAGIHGRGDMEFQDWKFDKRVVRRNRRRGLIHDDEYQAYLDSLPDVADNSMTLEEDECAEEEARAAKEEAAKQEEAEAAEAEDQAANEAEDG